MITGETTIIMVGLLYQIPRIPKGKSYVRMLVVRQIRLHNGAYCCVIPTTYFVHGERILPTAIRGQ